VALFGAGDLTTLAAPADFGPVATLIAQAMEPVDQQVRRFAAASPAIAAAPPAAAGSPTGTVAGDARLNVRAAPDTATAVIGQLLPGDAVAITGRTVDGRWLRIALAGGEGWVSAQYVDLSVPPELVPLAQPGP
jgi:uncharacterized protein YraI